MTSAIFGDANSGLQVGNNSGSITAEIHLAPRTYAVWHMSLLGTTDAIYLMIEPQEPTPGPLSTVPFPRDPDFVDRGTLLDDIHIISSSLASRAALVGIGGVGSVTKCLRCLFIAQLLSENLNLQSNTATSFLTNHQKDRHFGFMRVMPPDLNRDASQLSSGSRFLVAMIQRSIP